MPTFRGSLYFSTSQLAPFGKGYGWSENFVLKGTDYGTAWGNLLALANARKALLPTTWQLVFGKVSVPGKPPDAFWSAADGTQVSGPGTYALTAGSNETVLPPTVALLLRLQSATEKWGMRFLRGVTTFVVDGTSYAYLAPNNFMGLLGSFASAVQTNALLPVKQPSGAILNDAITNVYPIRGGWCRVGRPFGVPLGRARSR